MPAKPRLKQPPGTLDAVVPTKWGTSGCRAAATEPQQANTNTEPTSMGQCGDRPKRLAIGIAPLGIVAIGIVPMGVVSIGVVPMGVVSLGVVGMGVINAALVGMGVLVAGVNTMGLWTLVPNAGHHAHQSSPRPANVLAYPSKEIALQKARELGCNGAHAMGRLWMPCAEHPR